MIGRYRLTILILVERHEDITVSGLKRLLHEPVADTKADVTLRRLCDAGLIDRYGSPYRYYMTSDGRAYLSDLRALLSR